MTVQDRAPGSAVERVQRHQSEDMAGIDSHRDSRSQVYDQASTEAFADAAARGGRGSGGWQRPEPLRDQSAPRVFLVYGGIGPGTDRAHI